MIIYTVWHRNIPINIVLRHNQGGWISECCHVLICRSVSMPEFFTHLFLSNSDKIYCYYCRVTLAHASTAAIFGLFDVDLMLIWYGASMLMFLFAHIQSTYKILKRRRTWIFCVNILFGDIWIFYVGSQCSAWHELNHNLIIFKYLLVDLLFFRLNYFTQRTHRALGESFYLRKIQSSTQHFE